MLDIVQLSPADDFGAYNHSAGFYEQGEFDTPLVFRGTLEEVLCARAENNCGTPWRVIRKRMRDHGTALALKGA